MYDIWTHRLPDITGVSRARSKLLEQFQLLRDNDIDSVCYMPLFSPTHEESWGKHITKVVTDYNYDELSESVFLVPGHTLPLYDELIVDLQSGKALPLNDTDFVCIQLGEEPFSVLNKKLYELAIAGYYPIIRFPEQDTRIQKEPELLYRLVKNGAYTLMNAESLLPSADKKVRKCIRLLLQARLIHMVANCTDVIHIHQEELAEVDRLLEKYSQHYEKIRMNFTNLLEDRPISVEEPLHINKKKLPFLGKYRP